MKNYKGVREALQQALLEFDPNKNRTDVRRTGAGENKRRKSGTVKNMNKLKRDKFKGKETSFTKATKGQRAPASVNKAGGDAVKRARRASDRGGPDNVNLSRVFGKERNRAGNRSVGS